MVGYSNLLLAGTMSRVGRAKAGGNIVALADRVGSDSRRGQNMVPVTAEPLESRIPFGR